ncbi:hypothetical protein D3C71_1701070 [compost metagenome]
MMKGAAFAMKAATLASTSCGCAPNSLIARSAMLASRRSAMMLLATSRVTYSTLKPLAIAFTPKEIIAIDLPALGPPMSTDISLRPHPL